MTGRLAVDDIALRIARRAGLEGARFAGLDFGDMEFQGVSISAAQFTDCILVQPD